MLRSYDQIVPGAGERILAMAERQSAHRRQIESVVLDANVSPEKRGQILGFILCLIAIGGGIRLIAFDKDWQGVTAIIGALGTLIGALVFGRNRQVRELQEKRTAASIPTSGNAPSS